LQNQTFELNGQYYFDQEKYLSLVPTMLVNTILDKNNKYKRGSKVTTTEYGLMWAGNKPFLFWQLI
jgi:hypothetical protein